MRNAYITIGSKCNHRCSFCPCKWERERSEMPEEILLDCIKELVTNQNIDKITISGGEPTIHKNFWPVLKYLSTTSVKTELLTNADVLSDESIVNKISEIMPAKKLKLTTAIHSIDPEIHELITGSKGSLMRSLKGIHNMISLGYPYSIKICISKMNYKNIPELTEFLCQEFPDFVNIIFCNIDYYGYTTDNYSSVKIGFREIRPYLEKSLGFYENSKTMSYSRRVTVTNMPLCCLEPKYWKYVIVDSKNSTKAFLPFYDNSTHEQNRILYDVKSRSGTFGLACKKCEVESYCPGLWSTAINTLGEGDLRPIKIQRY